LHVVHPQRRRRPVSSEVRSVALMAGGRSELLITRLRDLTRDVLKCPLSMRARVSESFLRSAREARRSGNLIRLTSGSSSRSTRTVRTMLIGRNLHNATQLNL